MIVLEEGIGDTEAGEFSLVVGFEKRAAGVAMDYRSQLVDTWEGGFDSLHLRRILRMLVLSGQLRSGACDRIQ